MMLSGSSNLLQVGSVGSGYASVDPLFAGCLPSKPLALTGARQMAQKTTGTPRGRVCPFNKLRPSRASTILLWYS
jgi:hypothetical protein